MYACVRAKNENEQMNVQVNVRLCVYVYQKGREKKVTITYESGKKISHLKYRTVVNSPRTLLSSIFFFYIKYIRRIKNSQMLKKSKSSQIIFQL